ncbi:MAG: hypothetical protein B7Z55_20005, partial [Planctomycetales bacterium 12-60-4]
EIIAGERRWRAAQLAGLTEIPVLLREVAAGNPVIAKAHSSHPGTTRLFGEAAHEAATETGMPAGFVQVVYRCSHVDGATFAAHPLLGAIGYTGSRTAGTQLKTAADAVGKPIYLELSSINPVFVLPGAVAQNGAAFAEQFSGSCLMGTGQFCTNPGLVITIAGAATEAMIADLAQRFSTASVGVLLGEGVQRNLKYAVESSPGDIRCRDLVSVSRTPYCV